MAAPDPLTFRTAMSGLPTGVTVVSAPGPDGPAGATANAVTSLSLDPPLMLACLERASRTLAAVQTAERFAINVLHAGQADLARAFATKAPHDEKWSEVAWSERHGVPVLADALAWVACALRETHDGGDHAIVTGTVLGLDGSGEGDPLVFHRGVYRGLG
jgi:3-hydroxy-9,10-secoandrosta-1,3,5(10)-triene-9,17-dione monooxygenase reductase component